MGIATITVYFVVLSGVGEPIQVSGNCDSLERYVLFCVHGCVEEPIQVSGNCDLSVAGFGKK